MLITLSGWSQSLLLIDMGPDALDFSNPSGCEQLLRCPTHIAGNRLDLLMTDVPDIVDVVICTPLGTSDHRLSVVCFVLSRRCRVQCQKYCLSKASYQLGQCP